MGQRNQFQSQHAIGARVWVEVRYRAHKPGRRGPRGVSTPLYQGMSVQISLIRRVCFYTCICCLMHHIHASCLIGLGLEVEASGEASVWKFSSKI